MDGSDHSRVSSSMPIKRSSTPRHSSTDAGTNENDHSYHQMATSLQNSHKPFAKHFMSPTISASSKAIAPRKKILAERNEISDTSTQRTPLVNDSLSFNGDSSLSPYDPLPNYPSPRPRFLRYKPNRRREIVLSCENEGKGTSKKDEEADSVCDSEEMDDEEEEEEKEGFLRRVVMLMLVLGALVSSTLYISSMNSPEVSSHTQKAVEGFNDKYLKIHDRVYGAVRRLRGQDHLLKRIRFKEILKNFEARNQFLERNMGLLKLNQTEIFSDCIEDVFEEKVEKIRDKSIEVVGVKAGDSEVEDGKRGGDGGLSETGYTGTEEREEDQEINADVVCDGMVDNFELGETESVDNVESALDDQMPTIVELGTGESEDASDQETNAEVIFDQIDKFELEETSVDKVESALDDQMLAIFGDASEQEIENVVRPLPEVKKGDWELEMLKSEQSGVMFKAVVRIAMVLAIIAPLVLAFHLKKKRNATKSCDNQVQVTEKCNLVLPNEREESIECVETLASLPKDLNQSRAPAVELLGEFVVGEMSSSFKSRGMKSSKMEDSEGSNYSLSSDKGFGGSKISPAPVNAQLDFSGVTAINLSPSHEYYTPQKKKLRKEDGTYGEVEMVSTTTTPVRRSSRIRNRAITSP